MSVHIIYYKDGAKLMRPVKDEMEYRLLRDSERNRGAEKRRMVQMNYSCLPNADGGLKGAERVSRSVGMDIDFDPSSPDYEERMRSVPELVMGRKEELGLLMLERSANKGYHVVFRRREGMTQEENLRWASELLGVEYDKGAKDITRVFFTPPTDRLLFVDKELFDNSEATRKEGITDFSDLSEAARNKEITDFSDLSEELRRKGLRLRLIRLRLRRRGLLRIRSRRGLRTVIWAFLMLKLYASGGRCIMTRRSL